MQDGLPQGVLWLPPQLLGSLGTPQSSVVLLLPWGNAISLTLQRRLQERPTGVDPALGKGQRDRLTALPTAGHRATLAPSRGCQV